MRARYRAAICEKDPAKAQEQRNIAFVENKIGDIFQVKKNLEKALEWYRSSLAIGDAAYGQRARQPRMAKDRGGRKEADWRSFRPAEPTRRRRLLSMMPPWLFKDLAENNPDNNVYQSNLSKTYHQLGDAT